MVTSSLSRYRNLVRHIRNWPVYFTRKLNKRFKELQFETTGNRLKFRVPSKGLYLVFKEIFVTDFYDSGSILEQLPANPVVVDIGANAGYFNMMLFLKRKDATVYAYEPIPANFELFKKNISLNPGLEQRIHLFNKAVTGSPQENVELFMETSADNSVIASVYDDFDKQNQYRLVVPAISLSEIVENNRLQRIDLLKVDCEGSEYPILYKTSPSIWEKIQTLFIEVHNLDNDKRNVTNLGTFLKEKGFEVKVEFAHTNCYALSASRK